jgi:hypothetical protein
MQPAVFFHNGSPENPIGENDNRQPDDQLQSQNPVNEMPGKIPIDHKPLLISNGLKQNSVTGRKNWCDLPD